MKKSPDLELFLNIINAQDDLLNLYLKGLPFFLYKCEVDKLLFFKYSKRKKCFDIKVGLTKEDVENAVKGDFNGYDVNLLFESKFNKDARSFGSSCNDIIRSFVHLFIDGNIKRVRREDLPFYKLKAMFDGFGFKESALLVPFKSRSEIVGFMLLYPSCDVSGVLSFVNAFGCALDKLLLKKSVENLEQLVSSFKEGVSPQDDKIYQLGKTSMVVAHEMKNALVGIIGLFNKLQGYLKEEEKAKRYYEIVKSQLNRIYNFVVDINKYSRFRDTINLTKVDISDVIDNSIEMVSAFSKKVKFSVSVDKGVYCVLADREQLQQVFLNLFKNSIEAGGLKGVKIDISVRKIDRFLIIRVKDNCGGIDDGKLEKITEPFFTTKTFGTGLGLSIVKSIIENHKGQISFRNVSGGLECIIKLPLYLSEEENV